MRQPGRGAGAADAPVRAYAFAGLGGRAGARWCLAVGACQPVPHDHARFEPRIPGGLSGPGRRRHSLFRGLLSFRGARGAAFRYSGRRLFLGPGPALAAGPGLLAQGRPVGVMTLSGKAKLAGIVGWPVTHSLSPVLHGHWLAEYGIDGAMVPLAAKTEDLARVIDGVRRAGFKGVNVTVPHKEAAFAIAHRS